MLLVFGSYGVRVFISTLYRSIYILQKSRNHLKILGPRVVTFNYRTVRIQEV